MTFTEVKAMAAESPWPVIHAERAALAEDLAGLTGDGPDTLRARS
jgi:hypothetical protein